MIGCMAAAGRALAGSQSGRSAGGPSGSSGGRDELLLDPGPSGGIPCLPLALRSRRRAGVNARPDLPHSSRLLLYLFCALALERLSKHLGSSQSAGRSAGSPAPADEREPRALASRRSRPPGGTIAGIASSAAAAGAHRALVRVDPVEPFQYLHEAKSVALHGLLPDRFRPFLLCIGSADPGHVRRTVAQDLIAISFF
jgi:hypothetical protein